MGKYRPKASNSKWSNKMFKFRFGRTMVNKSASSGDVVLLTGGSGFLGSHLLRILVERGERLSEIRVFDVKCKPGSVSAISINHFDGCDSDKCSCTWNDNNPRIKIQYICGDIRSIVSLRAAAQGCNAIIHAASVSHAGNKQRDSDYLHSINVLGTKNVIKVCKDLNIEWLVYTSTTELNRTLENRVDFTENDIDMDFASNEATALPAFSATKKIAEQIVLLSNGARLTNNKTLHTLALRLPDLYGEGDGRLVPPLLRLGKSLWGYFPAFRCPRQEIQKVYVGNAAWAHVHAFNQMRQRPEVSGQSYIIIDSSSQAPLWMWAKPILNAQNIWLMSVAIPVIVLLYMYMIIELVLDAASSLLRKPLQLSMTKNEVHLKCLTSTYSGARAKETLHYKPLFSAKEAYIRAFDYYTSLRM